MGFGSNKKKGHNISMEASSIDISGIIETSADSIRDQKFLPLILPAINSVEMS